MTQDLLRGFEPQCLIKEDPARKGLAWTAFLDVARLPDAAKKLCAHGWHLEDITAMDVREGYVVSYAFDHAMDSERIQLRVVIPHAEPVMPSLAAIYQGAEWHEREASDFYGIVFEGNPNPVRLLLPPDMDIFPLRKKEAERASLLTLFANSGEIISKTAAFTLLDPAQTAETAAPATTTVIAATVGESQEG